MPRRVAGRSGRPSTRSTGFPTAPGARPIRRWWNGATKTIIGLGALATAIGAIVSLRPSPDQADSATLSSVQVVRMPIGEYRQRSATLQPLAGALPPTDPAPFNMANRIAPVSVVTELFPWAKTPTVGGPSAGTPTVSESSASAGASPTVSQSSASAGASPTVSESSASAGTPTASASSASVETTTTTGSPRPIAGQAEVPIHPTRAGALAFANEVVPLVQAQLSDRYLGCWAKPPPCVPEALYSLVHWVVDTEGHVAEPAMVAERVVALLGRARTVVVQQPDEKGSPAVEPLGMMVTVNVEAVGLRGRPLVLSWSILQKAGNKPLPEAWRRNVVGYRLKATSEKDTGSFSLWVPLPDAAGEYLVHLDLWADDNALASADSPSFG